MAEVSPLFGVQAQISRRPRPLIGRFAPSPSGRMHAGNIFMGLLTWLIVKSLGGEILLRIEDLDEERSKTRWSDQILRDFELLGLTWDRGPVYQSARRAVYAEAFEELRARELVYPCFCSRADIAAARAPHAGEQGVYPGTCRMIDPVEAAARVQGGAAACWRVRVPAMTLAFDDEIQGRLVQSLDRECGDFIVRRSDGMFAYQLAVALDDVDQGVNVIVRGRDLLSSTPRQRYLQTLLRRSGDLGDIVYAHGPLFINREGRRLAKRDRDASLERLLDAYQTPEGVIGAIAACAGLADSAEPMTPAELLSGFSLDGLAQRLTDRHSILWP